MSSLILPVRSDHMVAREEKSSRRITMNLHTIEIEIKFKDWENGRQLIVGPDFMVLEVVKGQCLCERCERRTLETESALAKKNEPYLWSRGRERVTLVSVGMDPKRAVERVASLLGAEVTHWSDSFGTHTPPKV
jgi:hypothetical protein